MKPEDYLKGAAIIAAEKNKVIDINGYALSIIEDIKESVTDEDFDTILKAIHMAMDERKIKTPDCDTADKWYDFLSGKGELAGNIACFITEAIIKNDGYSTPEPSNESTNKTK